MDRNEEADALTGVLTVLYSMEHSSDSEALILGKRNDEKREKSEREGHVLCFIVVAGSGSGC